MFWSLHKWNGVFWEACSVVQHQVEQKREKMWLSLSLCPSVVNRTLWLNSLSIICDCASVLNVCSSAFWISAIIHVREFVMWWVKTLSQEISISMWKFEVVTTFSFPAPLLFGFFCAILISLSRRGFQINVWVCFYMMYFFLFCFATIIWEIVESQWFRIKYHSSGFFLMFFEYVCMSALNSTVTNLKMEYLWSQILFWFQILFWNFCCNPSPGI